jgi:pantetheine-phosphate adenylyltransferase
MGASSVTTLGVYGGSFDPITNGHMDCIKQALRLCDNLIVAIGTNPDKKGYFDASYRHSLINESLREGLDPADLSRVRVMHTYQELLVKYAKSQGATHLFRGLRDAQDYVYERGMAVLNAKFEPSVQTVFLHTHPDYAEVSSSLIRGLVGFNGWENEISHWVPGPVLQALVQLNRKDK